MATTEDPRAGLDGTDEWRREVYDAAPERQGELFSTISGVDNEPLYSPENVELDYEQDLGWPGAYPFTRGVARRSGFSDTGRRDPNGLLVYERRR